MDYIRDQMMRYDSFDNITGINIYFHNVEAIPSANKEVVMTVNY